MSYDNKGNYTPPTGSENAAPAQVIRSATWNSIFTDLSTALTTLGNMLYTQNARVISTPGAVTIAAADALVEITVSVSIINLPAASLKLWPVLIAGNAAGIFGTHSAVITPNGADTLSGQNTLTLNANYQVVQLIPLSSGGWIVK
jgi:hypothetical protein